MVLSWSYHGLNIMVLSWSYHGLIMALSWPYHGALSWCLIMVSYHGALSWCLSMVLSSSYHGYHHHHHHTTRNQNEEEILSENTLWLWLRESPERRWSSRFNIWEQQNWTQDGESIVSMVFARDLGNLHEMCAWTLLQEAEELPHKDRERERERERGRGMWYDRRRKIANHYCHSSVHSQRLCEQHAHPTPTPDTATINFSSSLRRTYVHVCKKMDEEVEKKKIS